MEYGLIYPELSHTWLFAWSKLTSQLGRHMAALDEFFSFCLHHGEENGVTYIGGEHKGKWRKNSKLHIILQEQSPGPNLDQPHTDLEVWETAPLKKIHIKKWGEARKDVYHRGENLALRQIQSSYFKTAGQLLI